MWLLLTRAESDIDAIRTDSAKLTFDHRFLAARWQCLSTLGRPTGSAQVRKARQGQGRPQFLRPNFDKSSRSFFCLLEKRRFAPTRRKPIAENFEHQGAQTRHNVLAVIPSTVLAFFLKLFCQ